MKKAIYPGSFDPPTFGHIDVATRASKLVDHLIIGVGHNSHKEKSSFTIDERVSLFQEATKSLSNVSVLPFSGLLVDFAKSQGAICIIRSLRNFSDFEQETMQGHMNKMLSGIESLYLLVDEKYRMISSTLVKEVAFHGKHLDKFVPKEIEPFIFNRLSKAANLKKQQ